MYTPKEFLRHQIIIVCCWVRRSSVHEVIAGPGNASVHLRAYDAAQAVLELEVLDDGTEAVAADFGVEGFDDDFDVIATQIGVQFVVLEALKRHDRRDLAFCHELSTEVQESRKIGEGEVVGLVRVRLFMRRVGDIARRWTRCHQGVARERHVLVVGFGDGPSTEIIGVFATGTFQSTGQISGCVSNEHEEMTNVRMKSTWS